jgi:hypothetical protein
MAESESLSVISSMGIIPLTLFGLVERGRGRGGGVGRGGWGCSGIFK